MTKWSELEGKLDAALARVDAHAGRADASDQEVIAAMERAKALRRIVVEETRGKGVEGRLTPAQRRELDDLNAKLAGPWDKQAYQITLRSRVRKSTPWG